MDDGTMETAALRIGCKVNLTLRITGVRPNGWHELDTVFLPLDEPSDTLRLALRPGGGLALHCAEPGIDPENNTLTKAYRLFTEASGFRPGVEAVLEKGIPHGAGLGGGSADAAALLGWLNARAPEPLPLPELVGLAARIGGALAGEAVMVAGYFAYEGVVLGFGLGAAAAIPGNLIQGVFGLAVSVAAAETLSRSGAVKEL